MIYQVQSLIDWLLLILFSLQMMFSLICIFFDVIMSGCGYLWPYQQ